LRALEKKIKQEAEPEWVPQDEETAINLEHILPENPQDAWPYIAAETATAYYRRIGNMVLMQATMNSIIGNRPFGEKRSVLEDSPYELTKMVGKYDSWGPTEIEARQRTLAKYAVGTWPIRIE
jgi:hypothetical protein